MELRYTDNPSDIGFGIVKLTPGGFYDEDKAEYEFVTGFADEGYISDYFIYSEELWDKLMEISDKYPNTFSLEESECVNILRPGVVNSLEEAIKWIEEKLGFIYIPSMNSECPSVW